MADPEKLTAVLSQHIHAKNKVLANLYGADPLDADSIIADYIGYAGRLAPHLIDGSVLMDEALKDGKNALAEGAQGTFLDIDHGTYPFVTSSSPTSGGALTGLGVGPNKVGRVIGVAKAFSTRVGGGPFPCELDGDVAARLRGTGKNPWDEYGTTTGRPRRVGWLDVVMLRHAVRINGLTELAITKMDILSGFDELQVCVAYEVNGTFDKLSTSRYLSNYPDDLDLLATATPVYETLPGWSEDIGGARHWDDLPANAQAYVNYVEEMTETAVSYISIGPGRAQVILR